MIASRRAPLRRRLQLRLPRPKPRAVVALVALVLVVGGLYLGLRDSSLVAVQTVRITGVRGPDAGEIRSALRSAARNMTTLDVRLDQLRTAVQPYPVVKHLGVSTSFPHAMDIHVFEQVAVAIVVAGGRRTAVSADGTLLPSTTATGPLPTIPLAVPPGGTQLTGDALEEVRLLAAAPYRMLVRVTGVARGGGHGLTAALRDGPSIYFGSAARLREKWAAAIAVLGDPSSNGAAYVDVTVPARPAAGAGSDTNPPASGPGGAATTAPTGATGPGSATGSTPAPAPGAATSGGARTVSTSG